VAGHADVHALLRDHERFSSASGVGIGDLKNDPYRWRKPSLLLVVDPPAHARHRGAAVGPMTPRALRAFEELFEADVSGPDPGNVALDAITVHAHTCPRCRPR
jgi:cytochrome P450